MLLSSNSLAHVTHWAEWTPSFFVRVCPCVYMQMAETKGTEPGQVGLKAFLSERWIEATTAAAVRAGHRPGEGQQGRVKRCIRRGELSWSHWNVRFLRFGGRENLDYRTWKHPLGPLFPKCWRNFGDCREKQIDPQVHECFQFRGLLLEGCLENSSGMWNLIVLLQKWWITAEE